MNRTFLASVWAFLVFLMGCTQESASQQTQAPDAAQGSAAAGIVISNARIIDGSGGVIERGVVTVKDGRIASVSGEGAEVPGALQIDAHGLTMMPGFIDGHRHVIQSHPDKWLSEEAAPRMQEYLDAGFTTIQSCGDPLEQIIELRVGAERDRGPAVVHGWFRPPCRRTRAGGWTQRGSGARREFLGAAA